MTRINLIPEDELTQKHLGGEYHEISRVFGLVRKSLDRPNPVVIPEYFTLGRGHVNFFYDKLGFIAERYIRLGLEIRYRAYIQGRTSSCDIRDALKIVLDARETIPEEWWGEYSPTPEAIQLSQERINETS